MKRFFVRITLLAIFITQSTMLEVFSQDKTEPPVLRVMSWNILHGGRDDGKTVGPERVVDVIRESKADIIAMQETYGSGEIISKALGYQFHPRGTNVSIHSRFPILEDISVHEEFQCVGALIEHPCGQRIAFYSIWLPYGEDIWLPNVRSKTSEAKMQEACEPSEKNLRKIRDAISQRLQDKKYADVSIVIAGDFNSMSHLDYTNQAIDQYERAIDWKTSHVLLEAGFHDSYRDMNPDVDRAKDSTWSPRFPDQEQDRIDFIYYKSDFWKTNESKIITHHPVKFPSDHSALLTVFQKKAESR